MRNIEVTKLERGKDVQKGKCDVSPITSKKAIENIKARLFATNTRDYCYFVVGINTGLRCNEILNLTVNEVKDLQPGGTVSIFQTKTDTHRQVDFNEEAVKAIQLYLESPTGPSDGYLFSGKGKDDKMAVRSMIRLVDSWFKAEPLLQKTGKNYGTHTLRKTFGYHARRYGKVPLALLRKVFGHSSEAITERYIGIQNEEIKSVYQSISL